MISSSPNSTPNCYFHHLHQLIQSDHQLATTPTPQPQPTATINRHPNRPQLILTHDFKGGYYENPTKSNYSFEWLGSVDTFIYFSHHRVTIPPAQWITAAKTHHTRILGTLIFESSATPDLLLLVNGPSPTQVPPSTQYINLKNPLDSVSTYFADRLIDLAIHHQFHGWLVNIELDLLKSLPNQSISIVHALKIWLEYFRLQGQKRIGSDWQVCWYYSVSYLDGSLNWQSRLHPQHNLPFFSASSSIFLDYHWSPQHISATEALVQQLIKHHVEPVAEEEAPSSAVLEESDLKTLNLNWQRTLARRLRNKPSLENEIKQSIFFGVDVYGRGCPHGGGFSSWRAAREILDAGFSVALFAPGWTWESDALHQDRAGWNEFDPLWWKRWWRDERYFWAGLREKSEPIVDQAHPRVHQLVNTEPPNAYIDSLRVAADTKKPIPKKGTGFSELPLHKPLLDLFPVRPDHVSESFYTNWSLGTGRGFWVDGKHQLDRLGGIGDWFDMSMSFPTHDLAIRDGRVWTVSDQKSIKTGLARCDYVEHIGWLGSGSIEVEEEVLPNSPRPPSPTAVKYIWMNTTAVACAREMKCRLVWRPRDPKDCAHPLGIVFQTNGSASVEGDPKIYLTSPSPTFSIINLDCSPSSSSSDLKITQIETSPLAHGWFQSTCHLQTAPSISRTITRIGLTLCSQASFNHQIGEFRLVPVLHPPQATELQEGADGPLRVRWEPERPPSVRGGLLNKDDLTDLADSQAGKLTWTLADQQPIRNILYWLVYLSQPPEPSCTGEQATTWLLVAVLRDPPALVLPFGPPHYHLHPSSSAEIVAIHIDHSLSFSSSCPLS